MKGIGWTLSDDQYHDKDKKLKAKISQSRQISQNFSTICNTLNGIQSSRDASYDKEDRDSCSEQPTQSLLQRLQK